MGVSKNTGTPKSSILIWFSIIFTIHFGGFTSPYFWVNAPIFPGGFPWYPKRFPSRWGASYLVCAQHRNLVVYDYEDQAATATGKRMIEKLRMGRRHESIAFLRNEAGKNLNFCSLMYLEPVCPLFWGSTLQNKAFSNQNRDHLGSRYLEFSFRKLIPYRDEITKQVGANTQVINTLSITTRQCPSQII